MKNKLKFSILNSTIYLSSSSCLQIVNYYVIIRFLIIKQDQSQQLHIVLGEEVQITCTATNDQDAPIKLVFSWMTPNNNKFNITTTDGDNSCTATSTLHISTVALNHHG